MGLDRDVAHHAAPLPSGLTCHSPEAVTGASSTVRKATVRCASAFVSSTSLDISFRPGFTRW